MLHVAVDDTDSRRGGMCTTFLTRRLVEAVPGATMATAPHLVRLNPSVPWRTRGNGAVCVGLETDLAPADVLEHAAGVVEAHARVGDDGTQPGLAVSRRRPPADVYLRTVRAVTSRAAAADALDAVDAAYRGWSGGRGLVGAAAALAWDPRDPDRASTWELLAYRERDRWGAARAVDDASLRAVDDAFPRLFDTVDPRSGEPVGVPAGPDPVLVGLRGTDPDAVRDAWARVRSEPAASTTLFRTNQASDDHLVDRTVGALAPRTGARVRGRVAGEPWRDRGGHVFVDLEDATGRATLAAFEPTKRFRHVVTALAPGDEVTACGSAAVGPGGGETLHLEKLRVRDAPDRVRKVANPACAGCGARMGSAGRDAGYRCRRCGTRAGEDAVETRREAAAVEVGWYEVPSGARRHLARPVALDGVEARDRRKAYDRTRAIAQR